MIFWALYVADYLLLIHLISIAYRISWRKKTMMKDFIFSYLKCMLIYLDDTRSISFQNIIFNSSTWIINTVQMSNDISMYEMRGRRPRNHDNISQFRTSSKLNRQQDYRLRRNKNKCKLNYCYHHLSSSQKTIIVILISVILSGTLFLLTEGKLIPYH